MTATVAAHRSTNRCLQPDSERELVTRLIHTASEAGVQVEASQIVNFYVALKSKPLAILAGPGQSGKITVVRSLARVLMGGDDLRCQMMVGHAWWAEQSSDMAFCTEAQTRLNTDKILALIDEAWRPENANRVCLACLTRISPAELMGYFSEVAFQLRHGQIMRLPTVHLSEPIPYPPNLFLVATMDTSNIERADEDLQSGATIIGWSGSEIRLASPISPAPAAPGASAFLHFRIRDEGKARLKLQRLLGEELDALYPLCRITALLNQHRGRSLPSVPSEAMIYLANAWTQGGAGLFDPSLTANLEIALDLCIAQFSLAHIQSFLQQSPALCKELYRMLSEKFPRSAAFLERTMTVGSRN